MGLSASQARLLSITARLTDNEYHSQQIANAKMRLAAKGTEARQEYQDALNSSVLVYNGFDTQGNSTSTIFTPNVIYQYQPLKNQYALINNAGQILVNHTDAKNFEETGSIIDFLDRYKVLENSQDFEDYQKAYRNYLNDHAQWVEDSIKWQADKEKYQRYLLEYQKWLNSNKGNDLYDYCVDGIGSSEHPSLICYDNALNGSPACFTHTLNLLLDYDGTVPKSHRYIASCDAYGNYDNEATRVVTTNTGIWLVQSKRPKMKLVSDGIAQQKDGEYEKLCDGDDDFYPEYMNGGVRDTDKFNLIQAALDEDRDPTPAEILVSDYIYDPETKEVVGIKSLRQKTIDMYFVCQHYNELGISTNDMRMILINFTEGDLRGLSDPPPEEVPDPGKLRPEPTPPDVPDIKVIDKEKAQWYTNLWCRMNGIEEPPRIQTKEGTDELDEWYKEYILYDKGMIKDEFNKNYQEIDSHLASSTTWLQDVLSQGIVVMQRVNSHKIETQNKFSWDEIIYTDASELTIETDDNAIAKAEVLYEEKMHEIEVKDKRYQLEINKLDSEHNALQTQIDSIKSEVSKNIERSYKTFG